MNAFYKPIVILAVLSYGSLYFIRMALGDVETGVGLVVGAAMAAAGFLLVARERHDQRFLLRLFFGALLLRWCISGAIGYFGLRNSIAGDAYTYDTFGDMLLQTLQSKNGTGWNPNHQTSGWGMYYYVAAIYYLIGRSLLAIQMINCTLGALTCVLVYKTTLFIYPQVRVARWAAMLTAVTPSLALWSSLALKESPIMFCLCLSAYLGLRICRKFELWSFLGLLAALYSLYTLRSYAFFILFFGVAGALIFTSMKYALLKGIQGVVLAVLLGFVFVYLGAEKQVSRFDLKQAQQARVWSARASASGYGGDVDITDQRAALTYLPLGILYVLFAPFPWMVKNMGQAIAVPETIVWWLTFPLLLKGYWYIVRRRLLEALPMCIFTLGLTLIYALFQTNAGTVHRQRTQLLVFFVIFLSIGWDRWQIARREKATRYLRAPLHPVMLRLAR